MCYRHERRVDPASRDEPARVPPLLAPKLRRPAVGLALVAAVAVAAAVLLPDALNARQATAEPPAAAMLARPSAPSDPVPVAAAMGATRAEAGAGGTAMLVADDEVPPVKATSSAYGGCHHD